MIFTKAVPHKEIASYYQASDIFLFSSLTDTQGIVILEAIASGLPVVALKDDAFKEMVISKKNGFLIKKPLSEIFGKRVLEILNNPSLYQKFSIASQKIAQNFSEESQAKKLLKIYKSLIH